MPNESKKVSKRDMSKPLSESVLDRKARQFRSMTNKVQRGKGNKVSFNSAWEAMSPKEKAKHNNSKTTFIKAAKNFNKNNPNYNKKNFRNRRDNSMNISY